MKLTGKAKSAMRSEANITSALESVLVAVPYFAWANRGEGEMIVWLPRDESRVQILRLLQ